MRVGGTLLAILSCNMQVRTDKSSVKPTGNRTKLLLGPAFELVSAFALTNRSQHRSAWSERRRRNYWWSCASCCAQDCRPEINSVFEFSSSSNVPVAKTGNIDVSRLFLLSGVVIETTGKAIEISAAICDSTWRRQALWSPFTPFMKLWKISLLRGDLYDTDILESHSQSTPEWARPIYLEISLAMYIWMGETERFSSCTEKPWYPKVKGALASKVFPWIPLKQTDWCWNLRASADRFGHEVVDNDRFLKL